MVSLDDGIVGYAHHPFLIEELPGIVGRVIMVPTHTDDDVVIAFKPFFRIPVHAFRIILELMEPEAAVTRQDDAGMLYTVTGIGNMEFSMDVTHDKNIPVLNFDYFH